MIAGSEPGATGNACEWRLLAKDGVYVAEAPRNFGVLPMTPASRTDILLRCTEVGEFDWYGSDVDAPIFGEDSTNLATIYGGSPKDVNPWGEEYGDMKRKRIYPTTVATLVVTDSLKVAVEPVQFKPNRPCYAVDLMDAPVDRAVFLNFSMTSVWNLDSPKFINFLKMPEDHVASHLFEIDVGSVVEMELEGANIHPIHIHVNHQQLIESGPGLRGYHEDAMGGFTRLGDWHDTVQSYSRRTLIRMQLDKYVGPMTLHCHVLRHEDEGMMNTIAVQGKEGTTWSGADEINPTCWREGGQRGFDACFDGVAWNIAGMAAKDCQWVGENPSARCGDVSQSGVLAHHVCQKSCGTCVADEEEDAHEEREWHLAPALYSFALFFAAFVSYLAYARYAALEPPPSPKHSLVSQQDDDAEAEELQLKQGRY